MFCCRLPATTNAARGEHHAVPRRPTYRGPRRRDRSQWQARRLLRIRCVGKHHDAGGKERHGQSRRRRDYSTKEWDEKSGLYYFGARYYSPEIGRWTQRDPMGTADGLNLYAYVRNNPASYYDPWGHYTGEQ